RYVVPFEAIPEIVVRAFVAAEDDRFFEHQGIDPVSILRAAIVNFRAGHFVQGGSTITQQITKSLLLTPDKNIIRKLKELILSARLERYLNKQQILYLYLNEIYLGHGAYGVEAAAQTYFNKPVAQLNVAEAALIAGLPQAPGKYSPFLNSKKAKERQLYVLRRMQETGVINQSQMAEAAAQPLKLYGERDINRKAAPWVVENIRRYILEKYGEKALYQDGLKISIRSNVALTEAASKAVQEGLRALDKRQGWRSPSRVLATTADIEKHLKEQRLALVDQKLGYRMFLPDGRVDTLEAMAQGGIQTDSALLDVGKIYPAVVAGTDEKRKSLRILIGSAQGWIAWDQIKWAKPQFPLSRFFPRGSVIEARIEKVGTADFEAALEQRPEVQGALISFDAQT
ncbi:MAG: transglycosylase domain-containing protein, partial [Bdellovibrionota bacterium]